MDFSVHTPARTGPTSLRDGEAVRLRDRLAAAFVPAAGEQSERASLITLARSCCSALETMRAIVSVAITVAVQIALTRDEIGIL
jgi:hypothetical protein